MIKVDTIDTLQLEENEGVVTSLTRRAILRGYAEKDFSSLFRVLDAVDGEGYTIGSSPSSTEYPKDMMNNLALLHRRVSLIDRNTASVDLEYVAITDTELILPWVFEGFANLTQLTTNYDRYGTPIQVAHTFTGASSEEAWTGQTKIVTAEVRVFDAQMQLRATGVLSHWRPQLLAAEWIGKVNSAPWAGFGPKCWLVTNVNFRLHDFSSSPKKWKFIFDFQARKFGWDEDAIFYDPRTGRPPPDYIEGIGTRHVEWYWEKDFRTMFYSL